MGIFMAKILVPSSRSALPCVANDEAAKLHEMETSKKSVEQLCEKLREQLDQAGACRSSLRFYFLKPVDLIFVYFNFDFNVHFGDDFGEYIYTYCIIFGVGSIRNCVFSCFPSESRWVFIASHGAFLMKFMGYLRSFDRRIGHLHGECILLHGAANEPISFPIFSRPLRWCREDICDSRARDLYIYLVVSRFQYASKVSFLLANATAFGLNLLP